MKYLKTFNESVISGEDFLYKEISSDEYFRFDDTHNTINIEKETRNSISNLIKTDKKSEYKQKIGEFSYKISVMKSSVKYKEEDIILFRQYEDNWFIIWDNKEDGEISRFLLCDGFEGVEKYINDEVNTRYIKESVIVGDDFLYKEITPIEHYDFCNNHKIYFVSEDNKNTLNRIYEILNKKIDKDVIKDSSIIDRGTNKSDGCVYRFKIVPMNDADYLYIHRYEDDWFIVAYMPSESNQLTCLCDGWEGLESFIIEEVTYIYDESDDINESVFEGEDFLYKNIDYDEFEEILADKNIVTPNDLTEDKIYNLLKSNNLLKSKSSSIIDKSIIDDDTGFYKFTIYHDGEDSIYIHPLEDEWYLIELYEKEFTQKKYGSYYTSKETSYYIADGFEGIEKFIEEII